MKHKYINCISCSTLEIDLHTFVSELGLSDNPTVWNFIICNKTERKKERKHPQQSLENKQGGHISILAKQKPGKRVFFVDSI